MGILRKVFRFIAEYFVFFVGFLFIFVIGFLYASIRPEGIINLVFLLIVVGWVIFIIRYFWELMEKHKNSNEPKTTLSDLPGSSQKLANNKRS